MVIPVRLFPLPLLRSVFLVLLPPKSRQRWFPRRYRIRRRRPRNGLAIREPRQRLISEILLREKSNATTARPAIRFPFWTESVWVGSAKAGEIDGWSADGFVAFEGEEALDEMDLLWIDCFPEVFVCLAE